MRTNVKVRNVIGDVNQMGQSCYAPAKSADQPCGECGLAHRIFSFEEGTVWERVDTKHGSAAFSYDAEDEDMRTRRLKAALRRAVGHSVDFGWGRYGKFCRTGGMSVEGKYSTVRI